MTIAPHTVIGGQTQAAYVNAVIASNPAAFWPLDDNGGPCRELVNSATATIVGGVTLGAADPWGTTEAMRFDGTTGFCYATAAQFAWDQTRAYTVELWYQTTSKAPTAGHFNYNATPAVGLSGGGFSPAMLIDTTGHLAGFSFPNLPTDTGTSNDGFWHHAALVYDGARNYTLYRDGQQVAQVLNGTAPGSSANCGMQIGVSGNTGRGGWFNGSLACLSVIFRALSATEIAGHFGAVPSGPTPPIAIACKRKAWLTLGTLSVPLEDTSAGYFLESLDLGYPKPREVSDNLSDRTGALDRTTLAGPRVITASVHAVESAGPFPLDGLGSLFAPFMDPRQRPSLHYVLDRGDPSERVLGLRPADFSWPITGPYERVIALQWVAPDPVAYAASSRSVAAFAGSSAGAGRGYNWQPNRQYPGGSGGPTNANIQSNGELPVMPYLRIYGPITGALVTMRPSNAASFYMPLLSTARIDAGHFLGIDTRMHTAYLDDDPKQPWLNQLDWSWWVWPALPVWPGYTVMSVQGNNTSGLTQVSATWTDSYLT